MTWVLQFHGRREFQSIRLLDCEFRVWGWITIGWSRVLLTDQLQRLAKGIRKIADISTACVEEEAS